MISMAFRQSILSISIWPPSTATDTICCRYMRKMILTMSFHDKHQPFITRGDPDLIPELSGTDHAFCGPEWAGASSGGWREDISCQGNIQSELHSTLSASEFTLYLCESWNDRGHSPVQSSASRGLFTVLWGPAGPWWGEQGTEQTGIWRQQSVPEGRGAFKNPGTAESGQNGHHCHHRRAVADIPGHPVPSLYDDEKKGDITVEGQWTEPEGCIPTHLEWAGIFRCLWVSDAKSHHLPNHIHSGYAIINSNNDCRLWNHVHTDADMLCPESIHSQSFKSRGYFKKLINILLFWMWK